MNVQTLTAAPGDIIVITVPELLTQPQRDRLEAHVMALVAGTRVMILDGGAQMTVLKRPAPDDGIVNVTVAGRVEENEVVRKAPKSMGKRYAEYQAPLPNAAPAKTPSVDGAGGGVHEDAGWKGY